jgi:hypothetical protein
MSKKCLKLSDKGEKKSIQLGMILLETFFPLLLLLASVKLHQEKYKNLLRIVLDYRRRKKVLVIEISLKQNKKSFQ